MTPQEAELIKIWRAERLEARRAGRNRRPPDRDRPIAGTTVHNSKKTHCVRGHEFTEENIMWRVNARNGNPRRQCRACMRFYASRRRSGGGDLG